MSVSLCVCVCVCVCVCLMEPSTRTPSIFNHEDSKPTYISTFFPSVEREAVHPNTDPSLCGLDLSTLSFREQFPLLSLAYSDPPSQSDPSHEHLDMLKSFPKERTWLNPPPSSTLSFRSLICQITWKNGPNSLSPFSPLHLNPRHTLIWCRISIPLIYVYKLFFNWKIQEITKNNITSTHIINN